MARLVRSSLITFCCIQFAIHFLGICQWQPPRSFKSSATSSQPTDGDGGAWSRANAAPPFLSSFAPAAVTTADYALKVPAETSYVGEAEAYDIDDDQQAQPWAAAGARQSRSLSTAASEQQPLPPSHSSSFSAGASRINELFTHPRPPPLITDFQSFAELSEPTLLVSWAACAKIVVRVVVSSRPRILGASMRAAARASAPTRSFSAPAPRRLTAT